MKGIIIAAGMGSRLGVLTQDKPKCLLEVCGKSMLEHMLSAFAANNISSISLVKGYKAEKIILPGLSYYLNDNYKNNNILNSLMYAEPELNDEVVISYSDILYGPSVLEKVIATPGDIVAVVDKDWQGYYEGRTEHPLSEAEKVIIGDSGRILEIGKIISEKPVHGEFIGVLKLSKAGCETFKSYFHKAKALFEGKPFIRAKIFEKAYLTDMLQYLVNEGITVNAALIEKEWIEIDTVQDYERAEKFIADINLESKLKK